MLWPSNLIEELAYRRCILFLGAGVSATANSRNDPNKHPCIWRQFIEELKNQAINLSDEDKKFAEERLKENDLLMALQVIYDNSDMGHCAKYIKDSFSNFGPSKIHEIISEIDSKIIVTTNFDKIYDKLCNGDEYAVYDYKQANAIVGALKTPSHIVIKAHGTIDNIEGIVFTAKQYADNENKYPEFYNLLSALFLTYTVVFIGYSLNDPDISLVLRNIKKTSNVTTPHYILVSGKQKEPVKKYWKDVYNVSIIEYGDSYDKLEPELQKLKEEVLELREDRGIV